MRFELTTVRTLVGCSNHQATGNSSGEQQSTDGLDTATASRGHIASCFKKLLLYVLTF